MPKMSSSASPATESQTEAIEENRPQFPLESELATRPRKRYRFYNQQTPGAPLEATVGVTCIGKNGLRKNVMERYKIDDNSVVELPLDIVERWQKSCLEQRPQMIRDAMGNERHELRTRPRFQFIEES